MQRKKERTVYHNHSSESLKNKKMESPLLRERGQEEEEKGRCRSIWSSIFSRTAGGDEEETSNADTVQKLLTVLLDLQLAMEHKKEKIIEKKKQAAALYKEGRRDNAARVWATARHYEAQHDRWLNMRENVEQVKSEIVAQQQTAAVFNAFSKANETMGRIAESMKVEKIGELMDSLHEKIHAVEEVSSLLSDPNALRQTGEDKEQLERELEDFVRSSTGVSAKKNLHEQNRIENPTDSNFLNVEEVLN